MVATKLSAIYVEKPWGRHQLWPGFIDPAPDGDPIGEVWYQTDDASDPELMVKYLFTSERLSVQVHPNDAQAVASGHARGKDEAWLILDAEPDSTIALGTLAPMTSEQLREAALDGSIEQLLDWKPVKPGDFFYSPAGTVHAIGAGITLVEIQQNVDLTYRLYDYGRPRQLHLDESVAVTDARPFQPLPVAASTMPERILLATGPKFVIEHWRDANGTLSLPDGVSGWVVPVSGHGVIDGVNWSAGDCLLVSGHVSLSGSSGAEIIVAYPGSEPLTA